MEDKTKAEGTIDELRGRVTVLETNYKHISNRLDEIWEEVRKK
jgi:tetrahydromethanopterin S-methyltransferase subunit G